jgi:hypothetical protein
MLEVYRSHPPRRAHMTLRARSGPMTACRPHTSTWGGEEWQYEDEAAVNATANAWYGIEAEADLFKIANFAVGYQPGHRAGHPTALQRDGVKGAAPAATGGGTTLTPTGAGAHLRARVDGRTVGHVPEQTANHVSGADAEGACSESLQEQPAGH